MQTEQRSNVSGTTLSLIGGATIDGAAAPLGTLADLEAMVVAGSILRLPPGRLLGTAGVRTASTLIGAGMGKTIIDATGLAPYANKGVLVPLVSGVTISNLSIVGASIPEASAPGTLGGNAAGVRDNSRGVGFKLSNVEISKCQDGILAFGSDVEIVGGYIHENGTGTGQTHNVYVGFWSGRNTFRLTNLVTEHCNGGHEIKSRAANTISFGCHHTTGGNGAVYDVPDGGQLAISDGSMTLPKGSADPKFISYAMEANRNASVGNVVTITNEIFNDLTGTGGNIITHDPNAVLALSGCTYTGPTPPNIVGWGAVHGAITKAVRSGRRGVL
jgi:hypothetical protein